LPTQINTFVSGDFVLRDKKAEQTAGNSSRVDGMEVEGEMEGERERARKDGSASGALQIAAERRLSINYRLKIHLISVVIHYLPLCTSILGVW